MASKQKKEQPTLDISERMVPEFHKGHSIYGEHYIRYEAVRDLAKGKVVLDIASGSGYGSQMLAGSASQVFGVDVSKEVVEYAQKHFNAPNITYLAGDGQAIPLEDESVDVIISFETIEHVKDYKKFVKELRRVLKKDGLLVLSTPNELEFAEGNHYHLHEFKEKELERLVSTAFSQIKMYFQGDWVYSALLPEELMSKEGSAVIKTFQAAPLRKEQYLYFYALCSNRKIEETISPLGILSEHWSARRLQEEDAKTYQKQQLTNRHVDNLSAIIESKNQEIHGLKAELHDIKLSKAYRVSQKVKHLKKFK